MSRDSIQIRDCELRSTKELAMPRFPKLSRLLFCSLRRRVHKQRIPLVIELVAFCCFQLIHSFALLLTSVDHKGSLITLDCDPTIGQ